MDMPNAFTTKGTFNRIVLILQIYRMSLITIHQKIKIPMTTFLSLSKIMKELLN